jgi:hypothetical protein
VKQAEAQKTSADGAVTARLPEAYQWLLVPVQGSPQAAVEWQCIRLTGQDALAVRASKKLRPDNLLTAFAGSELRRQMDQIPLWRGDHVTIRQLVEDYARYPYLYRLKEPAVLLEAIRDGLGLLTWAQDSFAYADSFDEAAGRYRGLKCGQQTAVSENDSGLLVRPEIARKQQEAEAPPGPGPGPADREPGRKPPPPPPPPLPETGPRRFHGSIVLDPTRVGRDASRIADEVISHLEGLMGAEVTVTLEIEAKIPTGAPDNVVRTVTENSRTLKFTSHGFEKE